MACTAPGQAGVLAAEACCGRWREAPVRVRRPALSALTYLRHGVTHDVLACWFDMDRCTVTRAIGEVRPLLAERGGARPSPASDSEHWPKPSTTSVPVDRPSAT
ncbi:transposase family protein [Streptomyces globisporus]|uniref:transposase family protein n=1 Tax=Streptomyces globisporus TaxID=1908 RepID=UPI0037B86011